MILKGKFEVLKVKKKTSAKFFKDLKEGDEFELHYSLNGWYKSAPVVDIQVNGEVVHRNTANQLLSNLNNFELVQVVQGDDY